MNVIYKRKRVVFKFACGKQFDFASFDILIGENDILTIPVKHLQVSGLQCHQFDKTEKMDKIFTQLQNESTAGLIAWNRNFAKTRHCKNWKLVATEWNGNVTEVK